MGIGHPGLQPLTRPGAPLRGSVGKPEAKAVSEALNMLSGASMVP
ncbi:hypothetical protein [Shimia sp. R9_3]|nr:hypothetical protein [Shimia sp. R9_3]